MSLFNPHQGVHGELGPKLLGKMAFTLGIRSGRFSQFRAKFWNHPPYNTIYFILIARLYCRGTLSFG